MKGNIMKGKIFLLMVLIIACFFVSISDVMAFDLGFSLGGGSSAGARPEIIDAGLPGNEGGGISKVNTTSNKGILLVNKVIGNVIKYTSVIAVIALMLAGMMYLVSGGEEERVKKAKKWMIWALVGVLVSVSAWFAVSFINNLTLY